MPDINDEYEGKLRRHMALTSRRIRQAYINSIQEVSIQVDKIKWNGQTLSLSQYPALQHKIDSVLNKMHTTVYSTVVNSVKASWDLSNKKNDIIVDRRIAERRPNKRVKQILYDPNKAALNQFIKRQEKGLGLSDRVWNSLKPFRYELEAGLGVAITNGVSAKTMAKAAVKDLNDPDKLFRRVRDEKGKLRLSKPAAAYNPGQGVYRSSFKNAMRLTRTENNMAYRTSDHERWKKMPFVVGIEIKLSAAHPKYDICDQVKGQYPKDFKFVGWHPQCLCYQVPKLLSPEEYEKLEDAILAGEELPSTASSQITAPPAGFNEFVRTNRDRIDGWKNKPYWVSDNQEYFDNAGRKRLPSDRSKLKPGGQEIRSQFTNIDKAITTQVKDALASIDNVHGDGDLKDIPFKRTGGSYDAAFYHRQGEPLEIHLSSRSIGKSFSIAHEMGHYFDLHAIDTPGKFASETAGSRLAKIVTLAKKSDALQTIQTWLDDGVAVIKGKKVPVSLSLRNHFNYMLYPREIWARAYSQFIAKRSGSKTMLKGFEKMENYDGIPYQWADADFEAIEKAIKKYFFDIGWIVSQ